MTSRVSGAAGPLAVTDRGGAAGEAIVLVHGLGGTQAFWRHAVAHLAPRHRVVTLDLRGHGASGGEGGGFAVEDFAADVLAVADALGLGRFVLVGHSFGATVAIGVAGLAPERLRGLVLLDAAGDFSSAPAGALAQFVGSMAGPGGAQVLRETFDGNLERASGETRAEVLASLAATPHGVMLSGYGALLGYRPGPVLGRFGGPVLLLVDDANDSTFALHAQLPLQPRRAVSGTSHWLMLDRPRAVHAALDDFLAGLPATDRSRPA